VLPAALQSGTRFNDGMELRGEIASDRPVLVVALPEEAAGLDTRLPVLVTGPGKVRAASAVGALLATGDRFVAGGALRDHLAARADLCDMEGYAVALAAREAGVAVRLVKLVSDSADESAGATWQETLADHAHTLAAWVHAHL